jgi:hypothetical protein
LVQRFETPLVFIVVNLPASVAAPPGGLTVGLAPLRRGGEVKYRAANTAPAITRAKKITVMAVGRIHPVCHVGAVSYIVIAWISLKRSLKYLPPQPIPESGSSVTDHR